MKIKIRAWDKKLKIMLYSTVDEKGRLILRSKFNDKGKYIYAEWNHKDLIKMQYIGKKDINRKMIYTGDIVKEGNKIYEVYFDKNAGLYNCKNYYDGEADYPSLAFFEGVFEIIGNKFIK